jgi:hypothetical protein
LKAILEESRSADAAAVRRAFQVSLGEEAR